MERVLEQERSLMVFLWKPPLKSRMERCGEPRAWWASTEDSSSGVNSVRPLCCRCMDLSNISFIPFLLLQVPHITGQTWEGPGKGNKASETDMRRRIHE